jgi:hypothetical protein
MLPMYFATITPAGLAATAMKKFLLSVRSEA